MVRWKSTVVYLGAVVLTLLGFFGVRTLGSSLEGPVAAGGAAFDAALPAPAFDVLGHVLIAFVVIVLVSRGLGSLFARFGQPPVVGEIVAGILLGPSLLGRIAPEGSAFLFPPQVTPHLGVLAQVGVILYMFLVGLHLDTRLLRRKTEASIAISHASILAPFLLGSILALWLYTRWAGAGVPFTVFALFLGVSMSVTAFPVLARILTDRKIHKSRLGTLALACAAVDDVTAWCLLALVVGVARSEPNKVLVTVGLTAAFIALLYFVIRPVARKFVARRAVAPGSPQTTLAVACVALLLSALATESIGIHALFGAFLLGAVIPHDSSVARELLGKLEDAVVVLLLPVFFAYTGLRTQIGLVNGVEEWLACILIVLVASTGKFGGSLLAARATGSGWREAASLGVLMNTRGLMELIVLNVGLDLGVLSPTLFAMLVLMAVVTTLATTPTLALLGVEEDPARVAQSGEVRSRAAK
jgi:Kef-type K+ transport system membrane component KefB